LSAEGASSLQTRIDSHLFNGVRYQIQALLDGNQFDDADGEAEALGISPASWPFFGMLWPAGLLLADLTGREPLRGGRMLELGCGLGMASLVANARGIDILATDYHPRAASFLDDNSRRNHLSDTPFQRMDWRVPQPLLGLFDSIIGSDLLYEPEHPAQLSRFLAQHSHAETHILIVDPKRRLFVEFIKRMQALGFTACRASGSDQHFLDFGFKGVILRFSALQAV
jgi:predicted nicotinamide N-methyase